MRRRNRSGTILRITEEMIAEKRAYLQTYAEPYTYRLEKPDGGMIVHDMLDDKVNAGLASIYALASQEGRKVNFSGEGADEIVLTTRSGLRPPS